MRYFDLTLSLSRSAIASSGVEPEDRRQCRDRLPPRLGRQLVGRGDESLALDGRGQDDRAGPVEDVAALARRVDGDGRLGQRLRGEPLAIDDLPVAETGDQRQRADDEDDEQEEQAAARIGTAQHRSVDRLVRLEDDGFGQLAEAGVDGPACGWPARGRGG